MWCTSQLTSARENGKLPNFELRHERMFWVWFQFKHVFWVLKRTVSSERRDGSFEYSRQMFVKKPSYMSITHSHILEVWDIAMETAANRLSLYFEAHCLKFWNIFRQFVDVLCCRLVYWSKTCSGNLCIFRSSDVMRSYLVGLETFCYYLPFIHVNLNETTYIEYFKHPVSRSK